MNKKLFVLSAFSALVLCGCPGNTPTPEPEPQPEVIHVASVKLNKSKLNLAAGEDETLVATLLPEDAADKAIVWSSSDPAVATVDDTGKVVAVGEGKATIKAASHEDNTKFAECVVTVSDIEGLKEALEGLGESIEAKVTLKKGTKTNAGALSEDLSYVLVQKENYSYSDDLGFGFGRIGDENGAYYAIQEQDDESLKAIWGMAYETKADYQAGHLLSGLGEKLTTVDYFDPNAFTYSFGEEEVLGYVAWALELDLVLAQDQGFGNVEMKLAEGGVDFELFGDAMAQNSIGTVELRAKADAAVGEVAEFLTTAEAPVAPYSADDVLGYNFVGLGGSYTSEYSYGDGLLEHEYVTENAYVSARDVGWTGQYAEFGGTQAYFYVGKHMTMAEGLYVITTGEGENMSYAVMESDPVKIKELIDKGEANLTFEGADYPAFWLEDGYYNPTTAYNYGLNLFTKERFGINGSYFSMEFGAEYEYENSKGEMVSATIGASDMEDVIRCYSLVNLKGTSTPGYVVDEYRAIELYVELSTEGDFSFTMAWDLDMHYVDSDGKADESKAAYDWKDFYNFGATENVYYETILSDVEEYTGTFYKVNADESKTEITSLTLVEGQTQKVDFELSIEGFTFELSVDDEPIATFAEGVITAVAAGNTYLTATLSNGDEFWIRVNVVSSPVGEWEATSGEETSTLIIANDLTGTFDGEATTLTETDVAGVYEMYIAGAINDKGTLTCGNGSLTLVYQIDLGGEEPLTITLNYLPKGTDPLMARSKEIADAISTSIFGQSRAELDEDAYSFVVVWNSVFEKASIMDYMITFVPEGATQTVAPTEYNGSLIAMYTMDEGAITIQLQVGTTDTQSYCFWYVYPTPSN